MHIAGVTIAHTSDVSMQPSTFDELVVVESVGMDVVVIAADVSAIKVDMMVPALVLDTTVEG